MCRNPAGLPPIRSRFTAASQSPNSNLIWKKIDDFTQIVNTSVNTDKISSSYDEIKGAKEVIVLVGQNHFYFTRVSELVRQSYASSMILNSNSSPEWNYFVQFIVEVDFTSGTVKIKTYAKGTNAGYLKVTEVYYR